jgi:hypothetical protein
MASCFWINCLPLASDTLIHSLSICAVRTTGPVGAADAASLGAALAAAEAASLGTALGTSSGISEGRLSVGVELFCHQMKPATAATSSTKPAIHAKRDDGTRAGSPGAKATEADRSGSGAERE